MKKSNKILAVLLALVMIITSVPMLTAMADAVGDVWDCAKKGHSYVQVGDTVKPTCDAEGSTTYICRYCADEKIAYTDALGHEFVGNYEKTEDNHTKLCAECRKDIPEAHDFKDAKVTVTKEPTCSEKGVGKAKCNVCGYEKTDVVVPAKGHTYSAVVPVENKANPENPVSHSGVCTVCNATKTEKHVWDEGIVTKDPQCHAAGELTQTCTVCKVTRKLAIEEGHTYPETAKSVNDKTHAYTCTVKGCGSKAPEDHEFVVVAGKTSVCDDSVALTITCKDCDYKVETKATEHDFDKVEKYDENGHKQTCKNCDEHFVVPHEWKDVKVTKEATCKEDGEKEIKCTVCGQTSTEALPKLTEHTWGEWEVVVPATPIADGKKARECKVCGKKEADKVVYGYELGDVNKDGTVSAIDARIVLQYVANLKQLTEEELSLADIDKNGSVTAVDARRILMAFAGIEK